ncbi:MAG: arylesterase, partial [Alphaproteobacteria bacterium]|nr:arylesterase [Alphaproteobacteria bacterium]
RQFDAIYPTLARRFDVILYPFMLEVVAMNPKLNQADGIHPNPAGVRIIADRMMPFVQKLLARVPGAHAKE